MRWVWFALGFGVVALALLAQWPATMTARWIAARSQLQLIEPHGTVWRGGAAQLRWAEIDAGRVTWQLSPWSVLQLSPSAQVQIAGPELAATATVARQRNRQLVLKAVDASLPGEWLQRVLADTGLGMGGTVALALDEVIFDPAGWLTALSGSAHWRRARVIGSIVVDLGDLTVTWTTPRPGHMVGQLSDAGGPLELSGKTTISGQVYRIDAALRPRGTNPPLRNALYSLGQPDGNGVVRLSWQGPMLPIGDQP